MRFRHVTLNLSIALKSFSSFKLRSALAVAGVVLGTLSLITVTNISASLRLQTLKEVESFGKNLLIVRSGLMGMHARPGALGEATNLTIADVRAIKNSTFYINNIAPATSKNFPVRYLDTTITTTLMGVGSEFFQIRKLDLSRGQYFAPADDKELKRKAIIGAKVAQKLFGDADPMGKYIYVYRVPCEVTGVLRPVGADAAGVDSDNIVYVPLNTYLRRFVNKQYVSVIYIEANDDASLSPLASQTEDLLRLRHNIKKGQRDDFTVINLKDVNDIKTQAIRLVRMLGLIVSLVSFTISAVGILSIMILMVNERRVEIGIRRAVGSKKRDIMIQFLTESSFISFVGGVIGCVIGVALSLLVALVTGMPFVVSGTGVVIAFTASLCIGLFSGIYPSKKAIEIEPIYILR
ncbi:MAG: ABC transporter permease [Nitrospirae bacterium]|uniref:ABC transporter permease n=1 Tax=Candidatus Magnetobacterium casense TaxID=1455061 RepID=UPI00058EF239|nr:ABC transporter permease [Candidatus Magnetobacterium casensis]MBF0336596.1 ABC transporter permease [Nitrospirota bacterium]